LVEQCFRKAEVVSSTLTAGSRTSDVLQKFRFYQKSQEGRFWSVLPDSAFFVKLLALIIKNMSEMEQKSNNTVNKWQIVNLAFELGFIIALPLVGLGLLGQWLDQKFGTEPWLTILGILFAITMTTVWMTRRFKGLMNKSDKNNK
jgi:F0F1-type ATP synthase assembly protein I